MFGEICQTVEDFNVFFFILVANDSFMISDRNLC